MFWQIDLLFDLERFPVWRFSYFVFEITDIYVDLNKCKKKWFQIAENSIDDNDDDCFCLVNQHNGDTRLKFLSYSNFFRPFIYLFFRQKQEQLKQLKDNQISQDDFHAKQIQEHEEAILRHKESLAKLKKK